MSPRTNPRTDRRHAWGVALPLVLALAIFGAACGDDDAAATDSTDPGPAAESDGPTATASLVVADVERSIGFYRTLGLYIPDDSIFVQDGVALHVTVPVADGFDLDLDAIEATRMWDPGFELATSGVRGILNFHVPDRDSVDSLHSEIVSAGYDAHLPPFDAFWGARYAVVVDPDGNLVGIMSADG